MFSASRYYLFLDGGLHGCIIFRCADLVDLKERIEIQESCPISKPVSLHSLIYLVLSGQSADDEAVLEEIHALWSHALVIAYVGNYGPKPRYPAGLIQEQDIHLAVICFQVVCVISVQDQAVDPPLVA